MGGRCVVVVVIGLLVSVAAADGKSIGEARRLMSSERPGDRALAVQKLRSLDSREGLRVLASGIRHTLEDIERLGSLLDKLDDLYGPIAEKLRRYDARGDVAAYNRLLPRRNRIAREYNELAPRVRALFKIIPPALRVIPTYRDPATREAVDQGARRELHPVLRLAFIEALAHRDEPATAALLLELLDDRDARARTAALRALPAFIDEPGVLDRARAMNTDTSWAVRLASYELIARAPLERAVPHLAEAAREETGEIAVAIDDYLFQLTGQSYRQEPQSWTGWWKKNRDAIESGTYARVVVEKKPGAHTVASFFSIPIESKRLVFAIDVSGSMSADDLRPRDAVTRGIMNKHRLPDNRLGIAKAEVIRAITGLPEDARFNVIVYDDYGKRMTARLQRATKGAKRSAIAWVKARRMGRLTNIYDALAESFGDPLARSGGATRFAQMPDTIVFLTDGHASRGRLAKTEQLTELVRLWNGVARVAVHCVGIGKNHDSKLLKALATENEGYYVDIHRGKRHPDQRRRTIKGLVVRAAAPGTKARVVSDLAAGLASDDWEKRVQSAKATAEMGARGARYVPDLIRLLADGDADVQDAVMDALIKVGERSIRPLTAALADAAEERKQYAAIVLGRFGAKARAAIPALIKLLDQSGYDAPPAAAAALGEIASATDADVIRALSIAAGAGDRTKKLAAHTALKRIQARGK